MSRRKPSQHERDIARQRESRFDPWSGSKPFTHSIEQTDTAQAPPPPPEKATEQTGERHVDGTDQS